MTTVPMTMQQRAATKILRTAARVGATAYHRWAVGLVATTVWRIRPEVVLGHDPWRRYMLHPDHRHAGYLLVDAVVAGRDPHFFPEAGLAPHRPSVLLLWEADEPDHVEDIGDHLDRKVEALLAHRSQFRSTR